MCLQTVTDTVEKRTGIKVLHIHSAHNSYNRQHIALCVFFLTCIKGSKNGQLSILLSPPPPPHSVDGSRLVGAIPPPPMPLSNPNTHTLTHFPRAPPRSCCHKRRHDVLRNVNHCGFFRFSPLSSSVAPLKTSAGGASDL